MRTWLAFSAAVIGAALTAAGVLDYSAAWLFAAGGAVTLLAALASIGERGSLSLAAVGAWLLVSTLAGWDAQWNLLIGGLLVVAAAFVVAAAGTPGPEPGPAG